MAGITGSLKALLCLAFFIFTFAASSAVAASDKTGVATNVVQFEDNSSGKKSRDNKKCKLPPWQYRPNWLADGDFSGEFEFRYSNESFLDGSREFSRDYGASLGYRMRPYDDWTIQLGLKTGRNNRPTTSWIPAEDLGDSQLLYLSEYWLRHEQKLGKTGELRFQLGRFAYPFDLTQVVFDGDLRVPGAYVERRWKVDGNSSFKRVSLGLYAAQLRDKKSGDRGSAFLGSSRLGFRWENGDDSRVDAAVSYLDFSNVDTMGQAIANSDWRVGGVTSAGETTNYWDGLGHLESDYTLVDVYAKARLLRRSAWPVELEVELVKNMAARGSGSGEDSAWFVGTNIGPNDDPGDLQFGAQRVWIESDAVLANLNRGEYATNYEATSLQARYIPAEHFEWKAIYRWSNSLAERGESLTFDDEELKLYLTVSW